MVMLKSDENTKDVAIAHNAWMRTNKYKHNTKVLGYVNLTLGIILLISVTWLIYLWIKYYNNRK